MVRVRTDFVLCSFLTSIEVKGYMQNLEPPRLMVAKHSSLEWLNSLDKGSVIYTKKVAGEYPTTMNGFVLIPKDDIVGVE